MILEAPRRMGVRMKDVRGSLLQARSDHSVADACSIIFPPA